MLSTIAVSFCNQPFTPELVLALLDPSTGKARWVDLQHPSSVGGATGLARRAGRVYVAVQITNPFSRLHIYDETTFELLSVHEFAHARDVHSVLVPEEGRLLVASTGTDELYELTLDGDEVVDERPIWRLPGTLVEAGDQCHLNSVTLTPDGIAATYCNSAGIPALRDHQGGGIVLVEDSTLLASGIESPHSLVYRDGEFYFCHGPGRLSRLGGPTVEVGGFARGLCFLDGEAFVGSSGKRWQSRSTGRRMSYGRRQYMEQRAFVSRVDVQKMEVVGVYDLKGLAIEVYDLLPVETEFGAKHLIEGDPRAERAAALEYELYARESWALR